MYYDFQVKVPEQTLGITRKRIKGTTYIYYSYNHEYSSEKKYTVPKATTIGKLTSDDSDMTYPQKVVNFYNSVYSIYCSINALPEPVLIVDHEINLR